MNLEINVFDYLNADEIKNICKDEVRNAVQSNLNKEEDLQRFLTNSSYHFVWNAIEENCPENMMDMIISKIPEIVKSLSSHDVFRVKNAWDREESKGWTLMQKALVNAEPLIIERVHELIKNVNLYHIQQILNEQISNAICKLGMREDEFDNEIN